MKFADRPPHERVAIDAWIRIQLQAREEGCMKISDDFKKDREKSISEAQGIAGIADITMMVDAYKSYQDARHKVSYCAYFQVSNPEVYARIIESEKLI